MKLSIIQIPNISQYLNTTIQHQLDTDLSIILVFKTLYRSDDVILDIYTDDISENTKIVSGKLLTSGALISLPNRNVNFGYYIHCLDMDGIEQPLDKYNAHKFYLQFSSYDDGNIKD